MKHISSKDNPLFKQLKLLTSSAQQRKKTGLVVLEGIHLAQAWLDVQSSAAQSGAALQYCITTESAVQHPEVAQLLHQIPQAQVISLPETLYAQLSDLATTVPLLWVISAPQVMIPAHIHTDCIVLDAIQDAGNVGSILRSAAAAGVRYALCTVGTAAVWSLKAMRAGMGAQLQMEILEQQSAAEVLERLTVPLIATSLRSPTSLYSLNLQAPTAWIFGNEGAGVCDTFLDAAQNVMIPQPGGMESLNVAAAAAVCLFEGVRQRRENTPASCA